METLTPLLFALGIGFTHAFEADHLVAIVNIVTNRNKTKLALKDGIFWGLGHTSTILIIGVVFILGRMVVNEAIFGYLEGIVGILLILLGAFRLRKLFKPVEAKKDHKLHGHKLAYGVGLIHGIAGSGAVILIAMTEIQHTVTEIVYLLVFGAGSIVGMLIAATIFSLPFSQKMATKKSLQTGMVLLSSFLCIGYGGHIIYGILG